MVALTYLSTLIVCAMAGSARIYNVVIPKTGQAASNLTVDLLYNDVDENDSVEAGIIFGYKFSGSCNHCFDDYIGFVDTSNIGPVNGVAPTNVSIQVFLPPNTAGKQTIVAALSELTVNKVDYRFWSSNITVAPYNPN